MSEPIYRRQERNVRDGRLVWYGPHAADDAFWSDFWIRRVDDHHRHAAARTLSSVPELAFVDKYLRGSGRVLEAGCGTGQHVATMVANGYEAEGVDFAEELIDRVRATAPDLPVSVADVTAIDCRDGTYDCYVSLGVIEHRAAGPDVFLAEAYRVVRPGGYAVISVPYFGPLRRAKAFLFRYSKRASGDLPFFQYGFTRHEFSAAVVDAGFDIIDGGFLAAGRLLEEEVPGYVEMRSHRGGYRLHSAVSRLVGRIDGHMVVIVAQKPVAPV